MGAIQPTAEQIQALSSCPDQGPFVMVNLLKFRNSSPESRRESRRAYDRYTAAVAPMLAGVGGRLLWMGDAAGLVIGLPGDEWDRIMLVEYPSRKAFLKMISSPDYLRAHENREAGLETSVLIASKTLFSSL